MSKKTYLLSLLLIAGAMQAETVTPQQALERLEKSGMRRIAPGASSPTTRYHATIDNLYVFSTAKGFIILPSDDRAPALLGYADEGDFSTEGNPAFNSWLDFYNKELDYLKTLPERKEPRVARVARQEIEPLTKTLWNQEWPYNIDCPKLDGKETVTGCVATAMAQGMKFYNYPERGKGEHTYWWGKGQDSLSFNYANHPFKWNLMADTYDRETPYDQRQAVAELMFACGVSVDMAYEPGGSGAATMVMGAQLIDIFGYSPSMTLPQRAYYGLDEWESMIYDALAKGEPVLYSGAGTAGGHQFICDGYSADGYFHFNWGWGGLSNGYFLLTALNPDDLGVGGGAGGFNSSQTALLNFRPTETGDERIYVVTNGTEFKSYVSEVKEGDDFRCTGSYFNYSLYPLPEGTRLGVKFTPSGGEAPIYAEGPDMGGFKPDYGRDDLLVKFPHLEDGTYVITPALRADGKWFDVRTPVGLPGMVMATVASGEAKLSEQKGAEVEVIDITIPETIYDNHGFPLTFSVRNYGELEFYSSVIPYLVDSEGTEVASSVFRPVDVLPGETYVVSDYMASFKASAGETIADGDYFLIFRDRAGKIISKSVPLTISPTPADEIVTYSDFKMVTPDPVTDPSDVVFSVTVNCREGYYYGAPHIDIFHGWGGYDIYSKGADSIYLTSGEKKVVEIHADLSRLADGEYICAGYDGGKEVTDNIRFTIDTVQTGIADVSDSEGNDVRVYDLHGMTHHGKIHPGIYIFNGRKIVVR